jgi:hypothetical protein
VEEIPLYGLLDAFTLELSLALSEPDPGSSFDWGEYMWTSFKIIANMPSPWEPCMKPPAAQKKGTQKGRKTR